MALEQRLRNDRRHLGSGTKLLGAEIPQDDQLRAVGETEAVQEMSLGN